MTCHDVDVGQARPIKQQPNRLNPHKLKLVCKEIKYMLHDKILNEVKVSGAHRLSWYLNLMVTKGFVLTSGR